MASDRTRTESGVSEGPVSLSEARAAVMAGIEPLPGEMTPLSGALGRRLAEDVHADAPVQGFDNSAMDGFAVRATDTSGASAETPAVLDVAEESRAGHPAGAPLGPGEAIGISTGAMLPDGADAVVRVEDTLREGSRVLVQTPAPPGLNIRRAGEDVAAGAKVLAAGALIGPAELGMLAAVGADPILCRRRPRVAVITSGDELVPAADPLPPGGAHDSNSHTVPALAALSGGEVVSVAWVPDEPAKTREAIDAALAIADALVICGGVSVGEHDHVKAALAAAGAEEVFWRVALKPGGPVWFGTHGATRIFGLPGNPVSVMVTFTLFANPALVALAGGDPQRRRTRATLASAYMKPPGKAHAVRCSLGLTENGWVATPAPRQGSHVLTSMLAADALAVVPQEAGDLQAGSEVEIELLPWPRDGAA